MPKDRLELNEFESLYMAALAIMLQQHGGSIRMTQIEYDACAKISFEVITEDGAITIRLSGEKLDG
jgi:hypothetical protein